MWRHFFATKPNLTDRSRLKKELQYPELAGLTCAPQDQQVDVVSVREIA